MATSSSRPAIPIRILSTNSPTLLPQPNSPNGPVGLVKPGLIPSGKRVILPISLSSSSPSPIAPAVSNDPPIIDQPVPTDLDTSSLQLPTPIITPITTSVKVSVPLVKSTTQSTLDQYIRQYFQARNEVKKIKAIIIVWSQSLHTYRVAGVKERITTMITRLAQLYCLWKNNQLFDPAIESHINNMISAILDNLLGLIRVATNPNIGNEVRLAWFHQAYQRLTDYVNSIVPANPDSTMIKYLGYLSSLDQQVNQIMSLTNQIKQPGDIPTISLIIEMYLSLVKIVEGFYPFYLHLTDLIYQVARHNCPTIGICTQSTTNHYRMIVTITK